MKKTLRFIALFLAFSCLFTITAFAATYNEDDYIEIWPSNIPGEVLVTLKADIPDVDDYTILLPELDIACIKKVIVFDNGEVYLRIILTELTEQATLDAIEALQNNEYVKEASPNRTGVNAYWEDPPTLVLRGDVNNDKERTNSDIVLLAQFIVFSDDNRAYLMRAADLNDDGFLTNSDLVLMARMIVGLD